MDSAANAASRPAQYVRHNTCGYCGNIGYDHKNCGFSTCTDCGTSLPDPQTNGKHFGSKCDARAEQRALESQTPGAKHSHDGKGKQHGRLDLHADVTSVVIETFNKEPLGALLYYATRSRPDISTATLFGVIHTVKPTEGADNELEPLVTGVTTAVMESLNKKVKPTPVSNTITNGVKLDLDSGAMASMISESTARSANLSVRFSDQVTNIHMFLEVSFLLTRIPTSVLCQL
jgi:phenylpyruvate tautomerase PptA (4-oxalocrotonate tautomerase family)